MDATSYHSKTVYSKRSENIKYTVTRSFSCSLYITDWNKDSKANFTKYWKGWDAHITDPDIKDISKVLRSSLFPVCHYNTHAKNISLSKFSVHYIILSHSLLKNSYNNVPLKQNLSRSLTHTHNLADTYFSRTTDVVKNQLRRKLNEPAADAPKVWRKWVLNWDRISAVAFLRSKIEVIISTLDANYLDKTEIDTLKKYIPWPEPAITAFSTFNYTGDLDVSLMHVLRESLGQWWSPHMHHIYGGMSKLPEKFIEPNASVGVHLEKDITFGVTVNDIEFSAPAGKATAVVVKGYYTTSGRPFEEKGDAVIVTTPLHIIREIRIHAKDSSTKGLPYEFYQAIENIFYGPSTKIMIQCKERFWEKSDITGGFSKTSLPIGQLHYPTKEGHPPVKSGILMCYTWKSEALLFGAMKPEVAIRVAVQEIARIHPEIETQWETGAVQAWYSDPSSQGAYVRLKPYQYKHMEFLMYPWENVYFAGEGISFASGWIQGALESGLRAAFQFYARNEKFTPT